MNEREGSPLCRTLPTRVGPYEVTRVLGRGGMGVVYHGDDPLRGTAVAVKTLERVRDRNVAGIRREIATLASLAHPGIVRIEGHGVSAGVPWYAMELLTGTTLRDHLREAQSQPFGELGYISTQTLSSGRRLASAAEGAPRAALRQASRLSRPSPRWNQLLIVLHGVCEALAHLHERGIVHRDLKPENIFVRADGSPVLVDFGISARFGGSLGREELDAPGSCIGTVAYMAPEQIQGEFVDARADLYALGCILYECLTGEPPFSGIAAPAVLRAHLEQEPLAPSLLVDGVPRELDRLTLRLLQKEPAQRLGFADDVARAIRHALPYSELPPLRQAAPYLYRPAFVGRRSALRELQQSLLALAERRRGGRVSLGGESGAGKTRLAMELVREAEQLGVSVILSRCSRLGVDERSAHHEPPLQAFAPLLMAVADTACHLGAAETERLLGVHARVLSDYCPVLAELPGYEKLTALTPLSPPEARARVLSSLTRTLLVFAERRPLLLVIDDLQWADELSLSLLSELSSEELASSGVLVLCCYRMDDASEVVSQVMRASGVRHLELSRFSLGEVSALVCGMLALEHSPLHLVTLLQRKCRGNPFFVVEYLRSAIAEGLLTREDGRWRFAALGDAFDVDDDALLVPDGIASLIKRRLADLDPVAQTLVHAGAVLGGEFDQALWAACAGASPGALSAGLKLLRRRQIVEDLEDGRVSFVHDAIRENAYRSMSPAVSQLLHGRAAAALEPRCAADPQLLRAVAHHFARASTPNKARVYYLRAGEFAFERYANADAIACFEAALGESREQDGTRALEPVLREKLADVLSITGDHGRARAAYECALADPACLDVTGWARLQRKVGKTWETHHDHERAGVSYDLAMRALASRVGRRDRAWWSELVQVHLERLWGCYWLNRVDEMSALAASVHATIEQHGSTFQRARFLQLLVMLRTRRERYVTSQDTVALAREACRVGAKLPASDRATLDFVLFFSLVLHGSLDEAEQQGLAVLDWANRVGAATLRTRCLTYLMVIERRRGRVEEVRRLAGDCAVSCAAARMDEYLGALQANLSWMQSLHGDAEQARELATQALRIWKTVKAPYPMQWLARFPLLALSVGGGDLDAATEHARRLLDPEQQRLPDNIVRALQSGVEDSGEAARARLDRLRSVIEGARTHHYL